MLYFSIEPSSDELKRLMMIHGGNYEHYHSKTKVTHVIATNLPDSKVRELKGEKVVRPEWITDRYLFTRFSLQGLSYLSEVRARGL